jgi:hypothetical protein
MKQGTRTQQAIQLAKARFAQVHPFDLADESWQQLFIEHFPGDVLEAVKRTSKTRDPRPEAVYSSLLFWITSFESARNGSDPPMWPPTDTRKL